MVWGHFLQFLSLILPSGVALTSLAPLGASWRPLVPPGAPLDACFTNVDKFVTPTSACSCLLHMHAGVYYTCTQVSMTPARRCPWYLHADVYYTCLQVTIAQKVTQMGMQLSMTLGGRCLWQQHADVFDTCTQIHCDQDDVIIILIHLDTYDYDLLTSWHPDY